MSHDQTVRPYWISWYAEDAHGAYELHTPWWISGYRGSDDARTICAAVLALSEEDAREQIYRCHDVRPEHIEFRFCEERPHGWEPFCDRFPRGAWMKWSVP